MAEVARRTDEATARARAELVRAVRGAAAGGMTQAQIARQVGRSQPEVSRLLRFHGSSALGMRLRRSAGGFASSWPRRGESGSSLRVGGDGGGWAGFGCGLVVQDG